MDPLKTTQSEFRDENIGESTMEKLLRSYFCVLTVLNLFAATSCS